jgi:hypothetical protein
MGVAGLTKERHIYDGSFISELRSLKLMLKNLLFHKPTIKTIEFSPSKKAQMLEVLPDVNPAEAIISLPLPAYNAVIVVHSGASGMGEGDLANVEHLIAEGLVRFATDHQVLVLDGATVSGSHKAIGEARKAMNAQFPLVGVSVSGGIAYPGGHAPDDTHFALEENHTHFLIVKADEFGAESDLLVNLANIWGVPHLAMIINGGAIVEKEAEMHAQRGTPLLVFKGSGRFADKLAEGRPSQYPADSPIIIFDITRSPQELYERLVEILRQ